MFCKIQTHSFQGSEVSVNLKDTVSLNCSVVQGGPVKQITWSKESNRKKVQRLSTMTSESVPGRWSSLRISNVSEQDAGRYKCEVKKDTRPDVCAVVLHVNCKFVSSILQKQAKVDETSVLPKRNYKITNVKRAL